MKKMTLKVAVLSLVILGVASLAQAAEQKKPTNFSADVITHASGQEMKGKLFVTADKTRMEMGENIVITRLDKKVASIVIPSQKMYMEQPIMPGMSPQISEQVPGEVERIQVGTETLNGKNAKKFKVTSEAGGRKESIYQWVADDVLVPLKMEAIDGSWSVEYQNITVGAQPDSLFEVPVGYQKMAMPSPEAGMPAAAPSTAS